MGFNQSFHVYDCRSKKIREIISYTSAQSNNKEYLLQLKNESIKGNVEVFCGCSNKVPMKVSNTQTPYLYPSSRKEPHAEDCIRNSLRTNKSEYERAWYYDELNGEYLVQIENPLKTKGSVERESNKTNRVYREIKSGGKVQGEATVFGLSTKINMIAWQNIVEGKKRLPTSIQDTNRHVWGASKSIKLLKQQESLQKLFYETYLMENGRSISKMAVQKDVVFVYMVYQPQHRDNSEISMDVIGKKVYDVVYATSSVWNKDIGFYVKDLKNFDERIKLEPHSDQYILAGFAYRDSLYHHKRLTLGAYCLIPITKQGLFVESWYEKNIYEKMHKENRLFFKPYFTLEGYADFIPDYVLIDQKKPVIGEIFGVENNPIYDERKQEKFNQIKKEEFKDRYFFQYHDCRKKNKE